MDTVPELRAVPGALPWRGLKDRIARSVFWMVWSRGVVQVLSLLSTLVVARLLSPQDYGVMALAGIWTTTLALVVELGLGTAIVQFPDLEEAELNACFWLTLAAAGAGYVALFAVAPAIAAWFASPLLSGVLRVSGLTVLLVALRVVPDSLLRKRLALDKVSQIEIVAALVTISVVLWMAWSGAGVWALVAGTLAMRLVQVIVTLWFARWWPGLRARSRRLRAILRYALAALGAKAGWTAYGQVDDFVLGKLTGDVVLGLYSMAKTLALLPVVKVAVVANQLAMPLLAGFQTDRDAMRASFLRGLRLVASLTVPLCLGMALVAGDLVPLALGDKWVPIVPLLEVLALFALMHSLEVLLPPVLYARYRARFMFWWTASLFLVMPFAFWAGAAWRGALGVALAWVGVYPILMGWMAREALRELGIGWSTVWDQLRPVAWPVLMMTAGVLVLRWTLPASDPLERLVRLVLAVGSGGAVYVAGIYWRGGLLAAEIREVVGWLYRPRARAASGK